MERINRKILNHIKDVKKKQFEKKLITELRKEVNIGANGTQKYVIKEGMNKGKVLDND